MSTAEKRPASAEAPPPNPYEGQRLTGAEAVIRSLETCGVEVCFGIPGGAILPIYDALASTKTDDQARAGAPRAGRRPHGAGLRARDRQGRRRDGDVRARRDEPRHAGRRRVPRLDAARGRDGPGADAPDRHGRLPGGRHDGHLPADRQALLPRHEGRGHPARVHGGLPPRLDGAPGAGADRHPEGHREHVVHVPLAQADRPARLPADRQGPPAADPGGGARDRARQEARALRRRRHHQRRRRGRAARARRGDAGSRS